MEWPSTIVANFVRRPTHFQRYWVWYTAITVAAVYGISSLVKHTMNGNIHSLIVRLSKIVQSNVREHILDPFGMNFYLTVRITFFSGAN